jgi:hypothetical protein
MNWLKYVTDGLTVTCTLAPLLAWCLRLVLTRSLVLTGRRSGSIFRFGLHNVVAAPFEGDIELRIDVLDKHGGFVDGSPPVLLCGPEAIDVKATSQDSRAICVKATHIRPLATWTIVVQGNPYTTEVRASLIKPHVASVVATEALPPAKENGRKRAAPLSRIRDVVWVLFPLLGYGLFAARARYWLSDHGTSPGEISVEQYTMSWLLVDVALALAMVAFIGFGYGLCVRLRRPTALLQGYVGLGNTVPYDPGQSEP